RGRPRGAAGGDERRLRPHRRGFRRQGPPRPHHRRRRPSAAQRRLRGGGAVRDRALSFAWLVARPIAHRGWHGPGRPENTLAAARAAVEGGLALECDIQRSADGEAVAFHDATLDRLTHAAGTISDYPLAALQ